MSQVTLTLPPRYISALGLPDRDITPATVITVGGGGNTIADNLLLQGFSASAGAFDISAFLLYGLYTGSGSTTTYLDQPGVLTLRRRSVALEVAQ